MMLTKEFNAKDKKITFIGTTHGPEKEKITYIKEYLTSFKPDLILIEGGFENATFETEEESIIKGWELGFTSFFAKSNNIPLAGNDPSNKECIEFILKDNFKDLTFLYFILRDISMSLKQNLELPEEEKIKITLQDFEKDSEWEGYNFSWENFIKLFKEIFANEFDITKEYMDYFNPNLDISLFNTISKELSLFRDEFIKEKLAEYIGSNSRILIIKGQGHFENYERLIGEILNVR